jgi:hypothetical protein
MSTAEMLGLPYETDPVTSSLVQQLIKREAANWGPLCGLDARVVRYIRGYLYRVIRAETEIMLAEAAANRDPWLATVMGGKPKLTLVK